LKWNRFQEMKPYSIMETLKRRKPARCGFLFLILPAKLPFGIGTGTSHMTGILEGLGRATLDISETPGRLLERAQQIAGGNRAYILITPEGGEKDRDPEGYMEELKAGIEQIRIQSGHAGKKHLSGIAKFWMQDVIFGSARWRRH